MARSNSPKRNTPLPQPNSPNGPKLQGFVAQYKGPVPPPEILDKLDKILPGAAERIFAMAEKEQNAVIADRNQMQAREDRIAANRHTERMTALIMAFLVCTIFSVCGVVLVLHGYEKIGATLLGTTLVGVVASFLYRGKSNPNNKDK